MFTIDDVAYTLKFNKTKSNLIERQSGKSIMAEFNQTGGLLPVWLLEIMFANALVEENENKPVKGQKAIDICDKVLEENGYQATLTAVVNKYTDDMGFMFR